MLIPGVGSTVGGIASACLRGAVLAQIHNQVVAEEDGLIGRAPAQAPPMANPYAQPFIPS